MEIVFEMTRTRVGLIDPSNLFREGLESLLRRTRFNVVSSAASIKQAHSAFAEARPEIIIAASPDCATREQADQLSHSLRELAPCPIILLLDVFDEHLLHAVATTGVRAILSKAITADILLRSLTLVLLGQQLFPAWHPRGDTPPVPVAIDNRLDTGRDAVPLAPIDRAGVVECVTSRDIRSGDAALQLSSIEFAIVRCLMNGLANKNIARGLQMSESTVKLNIKGLLRKMEASNRTQIAIWGLKNLFQPAQPGDPVAIDSEIRTALIQARTPVAGSGIETRMQRTMEQRRLGPMPSTTTTPAWIEDGHDLSASAPCA